MHTVIEERTETTTTPYCMYYHHTHTHTHFHICIQNIAINLKKNSGPAPRSLDSGVRTSVHMQYNGSCIITQYNMPVDSVQYVPGCSRGELRAPSSSRPRHLSSAAGSESSFMGPGYGGIHYTYISPYLSLHTCWAIDIHVVKVRFVCSTYDFLKLWFLTSVSHICTRARQLTINVDVNADVI